MLPPHKIVIMEIFEKSYQRYIGRQGQGHEALSTTARLLQHHAEQSSNHESFVRGTFNGTASINGSVERLKKTLISILTGELRYESPYDFLGALGGILNSDELDKPVNENDVQQCLTKKMNSIMDYGFFLPYHNAFASQYLIVNAIQEIFVGDRVKILQSAGVEVAYRDFLEIFKIFQGKVEFQRK